MASMGEWITRTNSFFFKLTNGRLGSRLGKISVLMLRTRGRKSGATRETPLAYYRDGADYLVVASNWGNEKLPGWYLNLKAEPAAEIQVKTKSMGVTSRDAGEDEYDRLWDLILRQNDMYAGYRKTMRRRIPIVVLTPVKQS